MARDFLELMALGRRYRDAELSKQDLLTIMSLTTAEQYFFDKGRAPVITDPSPTLKQMLAARYPEMYNRYHNHQGDGDAQSSQS
jgi:hypothetical protein